MRLQGSLLTHDQHVERATKSGVKPLSFSQFIDVVYKIYQADRAVRPRIPAIKMPNNRSTIAQL
jgi:hypothetical protein